MYKKRDKLSKEADDSEKKMETRNPPNFGNFGASFAYDASDEFIRNCHFLRLLGCARRSSSSTSRPKLTTRQCRQSCNQSTQKHKLKIDHVMRRSKEDNKGFCRSARENFPQQRLIAIRT